MYIANELKCTGETERSLRRVRVTVVAVGKAVPLQAWTGPEGSKKLRFPDFVTTAQNDGRLSALRTGHF